MEGAPNPAADARPEGAVDASNYFHFINSNMSKSWSRRATAVRGRRIPTRGGGRVRTWRGSDRGTLSLERT